MPTIAKYLKKPIPVDVAYIDPDISEGETGLPANTQAIAEISGWMLAHGFGNFKVTEYNGAFGLTIETLEGDMLAKPGWYIIRGVRGEFYPHDPDIFQEVYERLDNG